MALSIVKPLWMEEILNTCTQDDHDQCLQLIAKLSIAPTSIPDYTLMQGILRYKGKILVGTTGAMRPQLVQPFHQSALGGHSGERATY